jgi:glycosyltransferase A (GT-A) superfamily protein (DUF2064 family)
MSRKLPVLLLPASTDAFAAELGPTRAATLAAALTDDAAAMIDGFGWARAIRTSATTAPELEQALDRALREHAAGAALAIDATAAGLPPARLEAARAALGRAGAVLGPDDGGGAYLVGVRRFPRGMLADLGEPTFAALFARLRSRGMLPVVLDRWPSIHGASALPRLRGSIHAGIIEAPATARLLAPRITAVITGAAPGRDLTGCLAALDRVAGVDEILMVDGAVALRRAVDHARGDVLWLVRADVEVPADADRHIVDALLDPQVEGGAFAAVHPPGAWRGRLLELRSRLTGAAHAGQAIFARRDAFIRAGYDPAGLRRTVRVDAAVRIASAVPQRQGGLGPAPIPA